MLAAKNAIAGKGVGALATKSQAKRNGRARGVQATKMQGDKVRVAINGFGRIGRNFVRCLNDRETCPIEIVAVNQSGGVKQAAHLLKYDSVLGTFESNVEVIDDDHFSVDGQKIRVVSNRDPAQLPWGDLGVDIVIEGTGVFIDQAGAGKHLQAGAKRVLITAPAKDDSIPTYVVGVNHEQFDPNAQIVSNASCTTNCLAPFVKALHDSFGIKQGTMTTTHAYTGDQRLLDASHRDLRRARAAAKNVVPTSTGAAKAVSLVMPELRGKLDGLALRVPVPNISICDLVINTEKTGITKRDVNQAIQNARMDPAMNHVLRYTEEPLVSADYMTTEQSATVDGSLTQVMGDNLVKVIAWYDNEYGYTQRVVDLCFIMARSLQEGAALPSSDPLEEFCKEAPDADECRVYLD